MTTDGLAPAAEDRSSETPEAASALTVAGTRDSVRGSTHDAWHWPRLLKRLNEAGYVISRKPELIGKGKSKPRPYV